uniref:glutamate receptor 2.9-like n=1 Tax=Erigeron canadensis TaxID=72917 RepID=UPI001CB94344|nr:glutamate receptor 2.9-like [Erigeron canadensis]
MRYAVKYEFIPYESPDGESSGNIDDLVYQIALGKFDMVVGDVAILWNRSNYVDFTLPFSELGVGMLVPVKDEDRKNEWIFMKPLETKLWIAICIFLIYTGFVVWVLEHRVNIDFRGPPYQQVGRTFWFIFSTLVFAHREKIINNLSRFVLIVWLLFDLVLTSSYTASLSSILTTQGLQPTVTNIYELIAKGEYVGFQDGSFVEGILKNMGFRSDKLKKYRSFKEYENALSDGSENNGVSAIVDGIPYLKMLQAKNCNKYLIVGGQIYHTAGFGFALPKGSPRVAEFSKAISKVVEREMRNILDKWFGNEAYCPGQNGQAQSFYKLKWASFKGLFLIASLSSTYALVVYIAMFLYENKEILASEGSIRQKMNMLKQRFFEEKYKRSIGTQKVDYSHDVPAEENTMDITPSMPTQTIIDEPQDEEVLTNLTSNVEHQGEGRSISTPDSEIHSTSTPDSEIQI